MLDYHWVSYSFPIKIPTFWTRPAAQNRPKSAAVPSCRARCSRGVRTSETSEGSSLVFCLSFCGMCLQVAEIAIFLVKKIWKWIFSTLRTTYTHFKKESDFPMKRTLRCGILPLPGWSRWGSPKNGLSNHWILESFGVTLCRPNRPASKPGSAFSIARQITQGNQFGQPEFVFQNNSDTATTGDSGSSIRFHNVLANKAVKRLSGVKSS